MSDDKVYYLPFRGTRRRLRFEVPKLACVTLPDRGEIVRMVILDAKNETDGWALSKNQALELSWSLAQIAADMPDET